jgi:hypothetical protein
MKKFAISSLVLASLTLSSFGCGNANGLNPVYGKVLFKSEPAVGATVYFHRVGSSDSLHEQVPMGVIQDDGTFQLAGPSGAGAPTGDYVVLVEWKEGAGKLRGRSPGLNALDRLKGRYRNMKKPLLHAEIKSGANRLPTFELN